MDRRTFMKLMGGLASMPIVGRLAKPLKSETVQEGIAAVGDKGMELYKMVVAKVMKEGTKVKESGRVDSYKHPDRPDITVDVNQTDGSAEIYFDTDRGSKGFAEIRKDPEVNAEELIEAEEVYKMGGDEYYKDVEEGISGGIENLEEFTKIKKAMGGRVGYQTGGQAYDPRATTQDYTNALQKVSAGTTYQQQAQAKEYARNEAANELRAAIQGGGIDSFLQGAGLNQYRGIFTDTRPGTNRQGAFTGIYNVRKEQLLDDLMNKKLQPTQYSQSKVNERRKKEYDDYMTNLIASTYGKADDYKAEAMTLGMQTPEYFDYLTTSDPKNKVYTYDTLSRDPYFDPKTYVPTDYSNPETPRPPSPYEVYYQQELQRQIDAGIPVGQRIQQGQVMGLPTLAGPGSQMGPGYEAYADVVARNKKMMGLKDGGSVDLTIITMPDISGSGVESLFKTR